jgi:hypothetical protein
MKAVTRLAITACAAALSLSCSAGPGPGSGASFWDKSGTLSGTWTYVGVRNLSASSSSWPVIAFSASGTAYVACRDWAQGGDLTVHRFDGTSWQTVGAPSNIAVSGLGIGDPPQIVVGPDGNPIVAYENSVNQAEVKRFDGTQWVPTGAGAAIVSAGTVNSVSLAVSGNRVYCAYRDQASGSKLTVLEADAATLSWAPLGLGFTTNAVDDVHVSADKDGRVWVVFADMDGFNALSTEMWNGSWNYIPHFRGTSTSVTSAIAVDQAGVAWWAGQDDSIQRAKALKFAGGSWVVAGPPGFSSDQVRSASLGFGPGGVPWFAYEDNALGYAVTVKRFTGTEWTSAGPDGVTPGGLSGNSASASLAVDSEGRPWVAFEDPDNGGISVMAFR